MLIDVPMSEKTLDELTVFNLKLHRDSLCELIQDYQANDRILDDYQRGLLKDYQKALFGIEMAMNHLDNIRVKY